MPYCPNCGTFNDEDNKFCTSCGNQLQIAEKNTVQETTSTTSNQVDHKRIRKIAIIIAVALILVISLVGKASELLGFSNTPTHNTPQISESESDAVSSLSVFSVAESYIKHQCLTEATPKLSYSDVEVRQNVVDPCKFYIEGKLHYKDLNYDYLGIVRFENPDDMWSNSEVSYMNIGGYTYVDTESSHEYKYGE